MENLLKKLGIKSDSKVVLINSDSDFESFFLNENIDTSSDFNGEKASHVLLFVKNKTELENLFLGIASNLHQQSTLAICFPKGKSKIQTDLTRDKGWEIVIQNPKMRWIKLISIDDNWSAVMLRLKTEKEMISFGGLMKVTPKKNDYFNAEKKEVYPPDFFIQLLEKNKNAKTFFNSLSYSHKREYVGYIVEAKKTETQITRAEKMVERLLQGKKNLTIK